MKSSHVVHKVFIIWLCVFGHVVCINIIFILHEVVSGESSQLEIAWEHLKAHSMKSKDKSYDKTWPEKNNVRLERDLEYLTPSTQISYTTFIFAQHFIVFFFCKMYNRISYFIFWNLEVMTRQG